MLKNYLENQNKTYAKRKWDEQKKLKLGNAWF